VWTEYLVKKSAWPESSLPDKAEIGVMRMCALTGALSVSTV
jgi:hypothetical protein